MAPFAPPHYDLEHWSENARVLNCNTSNTSEPSTGRRLAPRLQPPLPPATEHSISDGELHTHTLVLQGEVSNMDADLGHQSKHNVDEEQADEELREFARMPGTNCSVGISTALKCSLKT